MARPPRAWPAGAINVQRTVLAQNRVRLDSLLVAEYDEPQSSAVEPVCSRRPHALLADAQKL
jgi:hypothetical protein